MAQRAWVRPVLVRLSESAAAREGQGLDYQDFTALGDPAGFYS